MRIRSQLLLLLLAMGLAPLLVNAVLNHFLLLQLGDHLAERARQALLLDAQADLERAMTSYTEQIDRDRRLMEEAVRRQARLVARHLAGAPGDPGEPAPMIHLAASFEEVTHSLAVPPRRQSITLDDGDQVTFPLTTASTGDRDVNTTTERIRDPREDRTFTFSRRRFNEAPHDAIIWVSPIIDATTGEMGIAAVSPIVDVEGRWRGATTVEVSLSRVLRVDALKLSDAWSGHASLSLVNLMRADLAEATGLATFDLAHTLAVIAELTVNVAGATAPASAQRQPKPFPVTEARFVRAFAEEMKGQKTYVRDVWVKGRHEIWAYGPVSPPDDFNDPSSIGYLLVRVPQDVIVAQARTTGEQIRARVLGMAAGGVIIAALAVASVVVIAWYGSRTVTRPVHHLAQAARAVARGDLDTRVDHCGVSDEIGELAQAFNEMTPKLRDRLAMRRSLDLAKQVQQSLLPDADPVIRGLEISGASQYCDQTGGDYYDFIALPSGDDALAGARQRLGVAVGDVVGHGVAAALLMATARALIHVCTRAGQSAETVFAGINDHLLASSLQGRFITFFYAQITTSPLEIQWVSAGHDPALVYDPVSDTFEELEGDDPPLGVVPGIAFHARSRLAWRPGQVITLGTDGIWECFGPDDEMFGKQRLKQVIRDHADQPPERIVSAVFEAIGRFAKGQPPQDDITVVVIRVMDPQA